MGSEYFINSQELEDKVRNLLPSQGGAGAGFDLSASTQIIPIIDLTESAEGSNVRQDLQTAFSHNTITGFQVQNTTTTLVTNTGYFRVYGTYNAESGSAGPVIGRFSLNDGTTNKIINDFMANSTNRTAITTLFDFIVFLSAGDSLTCQSTSNDVYMRGCTRQIADIDGNLTNP